jgi:flagellar biosynthesis/type III secretory pathway protein FliH
MGENRGYLFAEWKDEEALEYRYNEGLNKGRNEGLTEGLNKGRNEDARRAIAKGLSLDLVSDITGLPIATLQGLSQMGD